MLNPADLFSLSLLATGGLYACMLAYFNDLIGTKRTNSPIRWNSEPILWILASLLTFAVVFKVVEPADGEGPGVWYLIGTGNLLVIYIYLVIELARHDLPKYGYLAIAGLTAAAVVYAAVSVVIGFVSQTMDLQLYKSVLATLFAAISHLLLLVLVYNLLRSLRSSMLKTWMADPNSRERLTAGGIAVNVMGEVSNAEGALCDVDVESSAEFATLSPDSSVIVDFGLRRIEDHGFRSDLRIVTNDTNLTIVVEVSNDGLSWEPCERENDILTDWDVPYLNSPWRYVRIRNACQESLSLLEVYDLD